MLANGATLAVKRSTDEDYVNLPGLKEIPDMGAEPDKEDNTCLTDSHKMYELGIGDLPDMDYVFKYDNSKADSPYRILRAMEKSREVASFKETLKDGTTTTYDAQVSVQRSGGGVNAVIEFKATVLVQSEFDIKDPTT